MSIREVRFLTSTEVRAIGAPGALQLDGYASVFNVNAQLPQFQERMKPGAFTRAIDQRHDVVCLFNHDANIVLGRTTAQTLRLMQDDKGLRYICDLPNTQTARDLHESIRRGDINGCSFAFTIPEGGQQWSEGRAADGSFFVQREISTVDLIDVSPVTHPCYTGTSVDARCAEAPVELRSAVEAKNEALRNPPVVTPPAEIVAAVEKREVVDAIVNDLDSFQDAICEIDKALAVAFPWVADPSGLYACGPCNGGKYYTCDTFEDYVIAADCATGEYFQIPYLHDESKPEGEQITFGEPIAVEKVYVASDRATARNTEFRSKFPVVVAVRSDEALDAEEADDEWDLEDRDKIQASYERLCATEMDAEKKSEIMGRIQSAASALGYECKSAPVVVDAPVVPEFEPFTPAERAEMCAKLIETFDPDFVAKRYSEDQPRDEHGRFGEGSTTQGERAGSREEHNVSAAAHYVAGNEHGSQAAQHEMAAQKESAAGNKDKAEAHMEAAHAQAAAEKAHDHAGDRHTVAAHSGLANPQYTSASARIASKSANASSKIADAASKKTE